MMKPRQDQGLPCPRCGHENSLIPDSRQSPHGRRRRRECQACFHRWSTMEVDAEVYHRLMSSVRAINELVRVWPLEEMEKLEEP